MTKQDCFPEFVRILTQSVLNGDGAEEVLHDALVEMNLPLSAFHFLSMGHKMIDVEDCTVAAAILGKEGDHFRYTLSDVFMEIVAYRTKCGVKVEPINPAESDIQFDMG